MPYWAKNNLGTDAAISGYSLVPNMSSAPYRQVVRIYTPVGDTAQEHGSGVIIAPGLVLTAWHLFNDKQYAATTKVIERASTAVGSNAEPHVPASGAV